MANILVVDDEELVRTSLARILQAGGHSCTSASGVSEARGHLSNQSFDLVLCDIRMPDASGLELLEQIAVELPGTATVMVTGEDDPETAKHALELGAYGYVVKPFRPNEILINVMNALRRLDLELDSQRHTEELEAKVMERNVSLRQAIGHLEGGDESTDLPWLEILDRLSRALALRDEETGRHIERVGLYCQLLAQGSGADPWLTDSIRPASMLHDAGKIGIPDSILMKPGKLTPAERRIVERHAELGFQLLSGSSSSILDLAANIALTHHERWDGAGYPRGLRDLEIPIEGRITSIADVFDALTSNRVYRQAFDVEYALAMMRDERGKQFDATLYDTFEAAIEEVLVIRAEHPDGVVDTPNWISVLVVEDQDLLAEVMVRLLEESEGISVAGRASTVSEAIVASLESEPDVALLDWQLPGGTGADAMREIRLACPKTKGVILTGLPDESLMAEAIEAGCSAVLTKTRPFDEIIDTIRAAHAGKVTIPTSKLPSVLARLRPPSPLEAGKLSPRETEVLKLLAEGLSNEAIAERLVISLNTVRNHVQRIILKMGAHSKLEAVTLALRRGLIELPRPSFAQPA